MCLHGSHRSTWAHPPWSDLLLKVTKMYANRAVKAANMREAIEIREEALAQVELALTTGEGLLRAAPSGVGPAWII